MPARLNKDEVADQVLTLLRTDSTTWNLVLVDAGCIYQTAEVNAEALVAAHERVVASIRGQYRVEPTITDLLLKATAMALREHQSLNARWDKGHLDRSRPVNPREFRLVERCGQTLGAHW